jgi:hypothetical protein
MPALIEVLQTPDTLQHELHDISTFVHTLSLSHNLLRQYQGKELMQQLAVIRLCCSNSVMETGSSRQLENSAETEAYRKVLKLGPCMQLSVVVQELHITRLQHVVHTQGIAASNLIEESHGFIMLLCQAWHISMSL